MSQSKKKKNTEAQKKARKNMMKLTQKDDVSKKETI